jgi:hypothetical protein
VISSQRIACGIPNLPGSCSGELEHTFLYQQHTPDVGNVHQTCRKAFERGLHAAADVIKRHGKASGSGPVDSTVVEEEIPAATSEIFDGE